MTNNIVYLNGNYIPIESAKISVLDRGFLFADGVYEIIPIYRGKFFRCLEHIKRLEQSLEAIRLSINMTLKQWIAIFNELLKLNNALDQTKSIYLQVTRGADSIRNHSFPKQKISPTIFVMLTELKQPSYENLDKSFSVITKEDIRWEKCYIKSISLLPNVLLKQEAEEQGAVETIFIRNGYAIEGCTSNLFIVKNNVIITPPKSTYVLGGITRELILELAEKHHMPCQENNISKKELLEADEVWITSSSKDIMPIGKVDNKIIGDGTPGIVWKKMIRYLYEYKNLI